MDYFKIRPASSERIPKSLFTPWATPGKCSTSWRSKWLTPSRRTTPRAGNRVHLPRRPRGQYPIFVRLVNRERISLKNCWFINMDEYLNDDETWIDIESPLSFRGFMRNTVYTKVDPELLMPEEQRVFPDPSDPGKVDRLIEELGGVDIAFAASASTATSRSTRLSRSSAPRSLRSSAPAC